MSGASIRSSSGATGSVGTATVSNLYTALSTVFMPWSCERTLYSYTVPGLRPVSVTTCRVSGVGPVVALCPRRRGTSS